MSRRSASLQSLARTQSSDCSEVTKLPRSNQINSKPKPLSSAAPCSCRVHTLGTPDSGPRSLPRSGHRDELATRAGCSPGTCPPDGHERQAHREGPGRQTLPTTPSPQRQRRQWAAGTDPGTRSGAPGQDSGLGWSRGETPPVRGGREGTRRCQTWAPALLGLRGFDPL